MWKVLLFGLFVLVCGCVLSVIVAKHQTSSVGHVPREMRSRRYFGTVETVERQMPTALTYSRTHVVATNGDVVVIGFPPIGFGDSVFVVPDADGNQTIEFRPLQ